MADPNGFYGVTVPEMNGGRVDYVFDVPRGVFVATQSPLPGETDSLRLSGKIVNGQVQANRVSYIDANGMETEATEATRHVHPDFDTKMMQVDLTANTILNAAMNNQSVAMPVGALGWTRSQLTAAPEQQPASSALQQPFIPGGMRMPPPLPPAWQAAGATTQSQATPPAASPAAEASALKPGSYAANGEMKMDNPFQYTFNVGADSKGGNFTFTWNSGNIHYAGKGEIVNGAPQLDKVDITNDRVGRTVTMKRGQPGATIFDEVDHDAPKALHNAIHGAPPAAPAKPAATAPTATAPPGGQTDDQIYAQYADRMQKLGATSTILAPPDLSGMQKRGASAVTVGIPYSAPSAQPSVNNGLVPPDGRAQFNQNHGIDVSYSDGTGWMVNVTLANDPRKGVTFSETATDTQGHKVLSSGSINGQDISVDTLKSANSGTACPKDPDNIKFDVMRAQATAKAQLGVSVPPPSQPAARAPGPGH